MIKPLPPAKTAADLPPLPEIYVLWHPNSMHGAVIAWQIRQWLRPVAGKGPQTFYRTAPAQSLMCA